MTFSWQFVIDLGILGSALLFATWLRSKVRFLQKYLIPNSLTAGFILLPFYNWVFPLLGLGTGSLENIVYHFLNLSFIANALRISKTKRQSNRDVFSTSVLVVAQYAIQCFFGTLITIILIKTIMPDLFPGFGLFATLGYSLGPGQAFAIGKGWETFGFSGLGSVGLTFGAIGFIIASFGGIFLINYGIRKGWVSSRELEGLNSKVVRSGVIKRNEKPIKEEVRDASSPEAIDPMSLNVSLVVFTYLAAYLILIGITKLLSLLGSPGVQLSTNLWGIMFIFSAMTALLVKTILISLKIDHIIDNARMTRVIGFSVDFMVAAAIAAISIAVVASYWLPIVIIAVVVGAITFVTHLWLSSRIFQNHVFFRMILVFGVATGTLPTGLALLRVIDPEFETPASSDYTFASGLSFLAVIPILLTANMPAKGAMNGSLTPTWIVFGIYAAYLVVLFILYLILSGRRRFKNPSAVWLRRK